MFGYVLLSNKNAVISFGGDHEFDDYIHTRFRSETHFSADIPSTSSGICTGSSVESLCADNESTRSKDVGNHSPSTNEEVTHLFLPLVSIYRSFVARNGDRILSLTSGQFNILLRHLKCNYLLISIGTSGKRQHQFLDFVELGLEVNIGHLLGLIDLKLMTVRLGSEFLRSIEEKHVLENHKVREYLDIRSALFFKNEMSLTLPFLKSLSSLLLNTLGNNRCFLLSNGEVLASYTSENKSIWQKVPTIELNFFFHALSMKKFSKQYEAVLIWLRPHKSVIPIFTDVIVYNNGGGLILVCLSETKYSSLISTICKLLLQLDRLVFSNDVTRDFRIIRNTVEAISQELLSIASDKMSRKKAGFLRNPSGTASFFQTIWQRTEEMFNGPCDRRVARADHFGRVNSSLMSLKSAFSTLSLSSSVKPRAKIEMGSLSPNCEMMMDYVRRQVTNLLQELCFDCYGSSVEKVAKFRETISHLLVALPRNIISDRNIALAVEKNSALLKEFMSPTTLGLDMVAYSVSIPFKLIRLDFIPDWISEELNFLLRSSEDCSCMTTTSGNSEKRYKLLRINVDKEVPRPRFGALKFLRGGIGTKMLTVAVFEEGFYSHLAQRQISMLLDFISAKISPEALLLS